MLSDEIKRVARKEWCREESAQMGKPLPDLCEGNCDECQHKFEDGLLFAALEAVAPMIRDAALTALMEKLQDPKAVHINMLGGQIARPTWANIKHLYPFFIQLERDSAFEDAAKRVEEMQEINGRRVARVIRALKGEAVKGEAQSSTTSSISSSEPAK